MYDMVKLIKILKDLFFYLIAIMMIFFILFFFYNYRTDWMKEVAKELNIKELPKELRKLE
jgi:hypothetical protein